MIDPADNNSAVMVVLPLVLGALLIRDTIDRLLQHSSSAPASSTIAVAQWIDRPCLYAAARERGSATTERSPVAEPMSPFA
jgi:hypothetical protein